MLKNHGRESRNELEKSEPSESFSDWLASIVERKRAEIRDLKPSKENAGYKVARKQEEG